MITDAGVPFMCVALTRSNLHITTGLLQSSTVPIACVILDSSPCTALQSSNGSGPQLLSTPPPVPIKFTTYGRTPWMSMACTYTGQQDIEIPRTNIHNLKGIRTRDPVYEHSKRYSWLTLRQMLITLMMKSLNVSIFIVLNSGWTEVWFAKNSGWKSQDETKTDCGRVPYSS
jgi:hypothetical protein